MIVAIHQPQYLPWVPLCAKADACDVFIYLDTVQFDKNGVQKRNQIKTPQGPQWLTVPVSASSETTILETRIAEPGWAKKHVRMIEQHYAKALYIACFRDGLAPILQQPWENLAALNIAVSEWMFVQLGINCRRVRASKLHPHGTKDELNLGLCKEVGGTVYLSGQGARIYQNEETFRAQGIELRYHEYHSRPYAQCYPQLGFVADLSALDLILNVGPEARAIMLAGNPSASAAASDGDRPDFRGQPAQQDPENGTVLLAPRVDPTPRRVP